jgi:ABC transporter substrate binding protein
MNIGSCSPNCAARSAAALGSLGSFIPMNPAPTHMQWTVGGGALPTTRNRRCCALGRTSSISQLFLFARAINFTLCVLQSHRAKYSTSEARNRYEQHQNGYVHAQQPIQYFVKSYPLGESYLNRKRLPQPTPRLAGADCPAPPQRSPGERFAPAGLAPPPPTQAAPALGLQIQVYNASTIPEIDAAFATLSREHVDALFVAADAFFVSRRGQFATLTARDRIPATYPSHDFVAGGGLMSYGADILEMFHGVGVYTGKVLHGTKPADMPVQQTTKFEFTINLQTARALGIEIPSGLLAIADEVVE